MKLGTIGLQMVEHFSGKVLATSLSSRVQMVDPISGEVVAEGSEIQLFIDKKEDEEVMGLPVSPVEVEDKQELEALRAFKLDVGLKLVAIENAIKTAHRDSTFVKSEILCAVAEMLNTYFDPCPKNSHRE